VLVDGEVRQSCRWTVGQLANASITTIEGLAGREAEALREAWIACDVVQCGYCQSAQLIAAAHLLRQCPSPSDEEIRCELAHIYCRCGTFPRILKAVRRAAETLGGRRRAPPAPTPTPAPSASPGGPCKSGSERDCPS